MQIGLTYMGLVRRLGAEAALVLASDRTRSDWHPNLLSTDQFDEILVAVRAPGDPDEMMTLVDPCSGLPFGEIPWWVTGGKAPMTTPSGFRPIDLKVSEAEKNHSETRGEIAWGESGEATVRWSRAGSGQYGYLDHLVLRLLTPDKRSKCLAEICGAGRDLEVSLAESPKIDDLGSAFQLRCEGVLGLTGPTEGAGGHDIRWTGPWIEPLPDLSASSRHHPVILPFPRSESLSLDVAAPPGYASGEAPDPVEIKGPFGGYSLAVSARPGGFHVERALTLSVARVETRSYAGLQRFLTEVQRADRTPLVFVRAGAPHS